MKYLLNTNLIPMFSGTYNTAWEVYEYNDNGEEVEVDYEVQDLMRSIAEVYHKNQEWIVKEMKVPFIKSVNFTGGFYNPREYNFKTDELDFEVEINQAELKRTLDKLAGDEKFNTWLRENFSSYDGFMSFTPNNYKELAKEIRTHGTEYHQALGALITYLAGKENLDGVEEFLREEWSGNGYMGLDYKISTE